MKLNRWANLQAVNLIKKLGTITFAILLPIFVGFIIWKQSTNLNSAMTTAQNSLVVSLQTGDLSLIDKILESYKRDPLILSLKLIDQDEKVVRSFHQNEEPLIKLKSSHILKSSDGAKWGTVYTTWTPPWGLIILFAFVAMTIVIIFSLVTSRIWLKFSTQIVRTVEQLNSLDPTQDVPELVSEIYELNAVFKKLQLIRKREIDEALVELSQKVAHDIRSPLSAMSMAVRTAQIDDERKRIFEQALKRVDDICSKLLDEGRKSRQMNTDLKTAIEQVISEVKSQHHKIRFDFLPTIDASQSIAPDRDFESVISNLLHNAAEASISGSGVVQISAKPYRDKTIVQIRDHGIGIPKHVLEQLGKKPTTYGKGKSGNGLGFFNAAQWAQRHGGDIAIESEVNRGTEVSLTF